ACRAAYQPGIPVTPGPGGVDAEARYTPCIGVRHGVLDTTGRRTAGRKENAPPRMSPPMSDGLNASRSAAVIAVEARIRSRNPGANRSPCWVTSSVGAELD